MNPKRRYRFYEKRHHLNISAMISAIVLSASIFMISSARAHAFDYVVPTKFIVEPPTLLCLGFEWKIIGDDNHNATVEVSYRKKGGTYWKKALPLLRIGGELISDELNYETPHMFAGSIMDLIPDTEYECRFVMSDPDGIRGEKTKIVNVRTRGEPKAYEGGRIFHVYPPGYKGEKKVPAYTGLKQAYFGPGGDDWGLAPHAQVEPGDVILVHEGLYKSNRMSYGNPLGLTFHGAYVLTKSGTPDKPIVIKAAGDGEVIFDGDGCYRLFDVMAADNIHFEELTIRNTDIAFYAGLKLVGGSSGLVVRNCRMDGVGIGVITEYAGSKNFYIADNVIIGKERPERLQGRGSFWRKYGKDSTVKSFQGIKIYGQGHVVCHNYVAYFHDGIDVHMYGGPEEDFDLKCVSIDIYNNDIFMVWDDFIEADGGEHNIRILRNRCINSAIHGLSAQPVWGGPVYFIRNVMYHMVRGGAMKLNNNPSGLLIYHNTFCTEWSSNMIYSNAHLRSNLFLGTDYPGRPILQTSTFTSYTTFDYNGYRPNQGVDNQFHWQSPDEGTLRDYSSEKWDITTYAQNRNFRSFKTLGEFSADTGHERHGVLVDYDIFENVKKPDPEKPWMVYRFDDMDFRLKPGSAAVDAGCVLPNVNDGYNGNAPDMGAYEVGAPVPVYGPRAKILK